MVSASNILLQPQRLGTNLKGQLVLISVTPETKAQPWELYQNSHLTIVSKIQINTFCKSHFNSHTQTQAEYWSMRKVRPDSFQMSTIAPGSACAIVPNYDNDSKELHIPVPLMVLLLCILEPAEPLIRYQSHQWLQFGPPVGSWIQPVQLRGIQKSTPSLRSRTFLPKKVGIRTNNQY